MKRLESFFTVPMLGIFCLALVVRVTYNFTVADGYYPLHDSLTYQNIALHILKEHCYCLYSRLPTIDRAPLWPIMVAIIYRIIGPQDILVRLSLCLVGSATCVLLYLFAKDLFGERVGIFAGSVGAIYPFLYIYDGWLYSESLYLFLLLAFCYTLYHLQRTPHLSLMITNGVLLGLLSLTRPNGLVILASFLAWTLIVGWTKVLPWHDVLKSALIVSLVSVVLVAPWTIRNYKITHTLVPVAVGDGKVWLGAYNYETADPVYQKGYYAGVWIIPTEVTPWVAYRFPKDCSGACEVTRDNAYKVAALQWTGQHTSFLPFMVGQHILNMWQFLPQEADLAFNRYPDRDSSHFVVTMMETITPIIFALALLGLIVTSDRWRELLFIYFMIAVTLGQCVVFYGIPRFRAPIEPMLILLASGAMWWLVTLLNKHRKIHITKTSGRPQESPLQ